MDVHITPAVHAEVEQLLIASLGDTQIERVEVLSPADAVWRVTLSREPRTVIVKVQRTNESDPRASQDVLTQEERAMRFLAPTGLVPLVVASEAGRILILEDVGDLTLSSVLTGPDAAAAEQALLAYARALGGLHALSGDPAEYEKATGAASPLPSWHGSWLAASVIREHWTSMLEGAVSLGAKEPDATADAEVTSVVDTIQEPGRWLAFSGGDPCPGNAILSPDKVKLIDFEGASFRHAMLDAASLRFPFAWCTPWGLIPSEVRANAELAYQQTLSERLPEAMDADAFERALAPAMFAWMNLRLRRLPIVDGAGPQALRRRTQILRTIEAFIETTSRSRTLPRLTAWAEELNKLLRARWPAEAAMAPLYPAFTGHTK